MYAYVVFDPTSERFKFGISNQPHLKRFASYGTAFGSFDGIVISCNNTLEVENALKLKLAHCIVPHASGRQSEVALRGQGDANLKLAFQTLLEVRTLSKSIQPVLPDMECSTSEEEHDTDSEQLSEEAEDAEGSTQAEPDDDDPELSRLLEEAENEPLPCAIAQVAARLLNGSYSFCKGAGWLDADARRLDSMDEVHLQVIKRVTSAARLRLGTGSTVARAVQKKHVFVETTQLMQMMLPHKASLASVDSTFCDWMATNVVAGRGNDVLTETEILDRVGAEWSKFHEHRPHEIKRMIGDYFAAKEVWYGKGNGVRGRAWHARGVKWTAAKDNVDEPARHGLLTTVVKRARADDFITCVELEFAAKEAGMEVSKVKLGRLLHKPH